MTVDTATVKNECYKIHRGESDLKVVTPLKDGNPIIPDSPVGTSLPSPLFSSRDEIAHYRANLLRAFEAEISQKDKLSRKYIDRFLVRYNSGLLLQGTYKKLGRVSWRTFYRWRMAFNEGGVKALIPQTGRKGTSKVTDQEKHTLLALLLHQNRLKISYGIALTKYHLDKQKIESPSSQDTLRRFVDQFKKDHYDLWVLRREGEKALDDKVLPYIERDRNRLEVGSGLVADGHRLNFQVINPFTGKPCRPTIVLFWDWRSSYPLGWEIMLEENIQCIFSAFRNAIITLGKFPKWVYLDNGKAFKAKIFTSEINLADTEIVGMFGRLGINSHFAWPYNAKAKPIERFFGVFTDWFERLMPSFTGSSIEDKPAWTKRNEKLARSLHDDWIPKIPEVNEMMFKWREFYIDQPSRGLDGQTPREIFEAGKGPGVDPYELIYQMLSMEIKHVHRNGITLFGYNWYDEELYGYRNPVIVKYSYCDLSQIFVFNLKNEPLCIARPVQKVHPMASEGGTPKDMEDYKRGIVLKRSVKRQTIKIHRLLGHGSTEMPPWKEIVPVVPNIIEAIEKDEAERLKTAPRKVISPFVDEPNTIENSSLAARHVDGIGIPHSDRPWFYDDYEKYDYLIKLETLSQEDQDWIEEFRSRSSLYRPTIGG